MEDASVVLVVHSPDVEGSFERLASFWIPEVSKRCDKVRWRAPANRHAPTTCRNAPVGL